jgi:hypothetical protein
MQCTIGHIVCRHSFGRTRRARRVIFGRRDGLVHHRISSNLTQRLVQQMLRRWGSVYCPWISASDLARLSVTDKVADPSEIYNLHEALCEEHFSLV